MLNIYVTDDQNIMNNFTKLISNEVFNQDIVNINKDNIIVFIPDMTYLIDIDGKGIKLFDFGLKGMKHTVTLHIEINNQIRYIVDVLKALNNQECNIINIFSCNEEGQFKFYLIKILLHAYNINFLRIWFNSLTKKDMKDSIKKVTVDENFDNLSHSFMADLVINKYVYNNRTRLLKTDAAIDMRKLFIIKTIFNMSKKQDNKLSESNNYYKINVLLGGLVGVYSNNEGKEKIHSPELLIPLIEKLSNSKVYITSANCKHTENLHPLLFNQADIVNIAITNRKKYTVEIVKSILDSLYDNGYITNPDTSSRHLSKEFSLKQIVETLKCLRSLNEYKHYIDFIIKKVKEIEITDRLVNDNYVDNDIAIIPTTKVPRELNKHEHYIYSLIVKRFIGVMAGNSKVKAIKGDGFISKLGKVKIDNKFIVKYGHRIINVKDERVIEDIINDNQTDSHNHISLKQGEFYTIEDVVIKSGNAKGKGVVTIKKLLKLMENIDSGAVSETIKIRERNKGIGLINQREEIIEELIENNIIEFIPGTDEIALTSDGEEIRKKLPYSISTIISVNNISRDIKEKKDTLIHGIEKAIYIISYEAKKFHIKQSSIKWKIFINNINCPICHNKFDDKGDYIKCKGDQCGFTISKIMWNHTLSESEIMKLCGSGETDVITDFIFKNNKQGKAKLYVEKVKKKVKLNFKINK
ncbi:DNA topoisomerase [Vallitalea guaymasensis]|uniref:DNA topoisomerase n=1 Tax=Vallitalea guaymasensis TaxID=1185412 RepID=UPI000DE25838|nr:DNA topoisomerase [Vallitalea guaymasensis]